MVVSDQPTSLVTYAGEIRWMSPELIDPDRFGFRDGRPTKESDCYALGMVVYEVLSGQAPFAQFREFAVVRNVLEGGRPVRPQGAQGVWFTDELWRMSELCWAHEPNGRPNLNAVLQCLEDVTRPSRFPSPVMDEDVETDDQWDLTLSNSSTFSPLRLRSQTRL